MSDLTIRAAAAALTMTPAGVRKAIYRGTLRARAVSMPGGGFAYRIASEDVERYRDDHRTPRREATR